MLAFMPLIVVGADTPAGEAIVARLDAPAREIRVFVTHEPTGLDLRERGFKVATGDVSDESHVEAAALRCFSAVLIAEAARDDRERAFASAAEDVLEGWARAMRGSEVTRVIWVTSGEYPETHAQEVVSVDPSHPGFADTVLKLDEAHSIS
jgi:nucleoside-diphosphate-sugar epimerase